MTWNDEWDLTSIPDALLFKEAGRRRASKRQTVAGPPKVMHRCIWCKELFSARVLRQHQGKCEYKEPM